jgi:hypothetical protein
MPNVVGIVADQAAESMLAKHGGSLIAAGAVRSVHGERLASPAASPPTELAAAGGRAHCDEAWLALGNRLRFDGEADQIMP